jgi:DNA-binding transcriptional regulator YdaS (Cro superfamily)
MSARKLMEAAIARFGSEAALGTAIGYSQNAVHWAKRRGHASWEMALLIEHVTKGEIPARLLCPHGDERMQRVIQGSKRQSRAR